MSEAQQPPTPRKGIEWFLQKEEEEADRASVQPYGNLTELNTSRVILDAVGEGVLHDIVGDYLDLLETSSAIYEKNGDYAMGIFSSGWCRFLDNASRNLCGKDNNKEALACHQWHCHQACWESAKRCMETGQAADVECPGGLRLYALPIYAGEEIIGSINIGYGDPPTDSKKLAEIAERYNVSVEELQKYAQLYQSRPPFIIDSAKKRLQTSAKLIGEIVNRKQMQQERAELLVREQTARVRAEVAQQQAMNILDSISDGFMALDREWKYTYINRAAEPIFRLLQKRRDDLIGKKIWDEIPDIVGSTFEKKYRQAINEQEKVAFEEFYPRLNKWFQINAYPSNDGLSIYFQDITERKIAQEQLAATQKELKQQLVDITCLHDLSSRLSSTLDLKTVMEEVLKAVTTLQNTDMGAILLYDREQENLYTAASVGLSDEYLNRLGRIPKGAGCCGLAIAEGRSVIVENVQTDPIFANYVEVAGIAGYGAVYSVPLLSYNGEAIGTLVTYFRHPHRPSERDVNLVELYARQAGWAIDNARLYSKLQKVERSKDESLALVNALVASAPVGFGFHDRELRFIRVNDYLAKINGISPQEHLGRTVWEILPKELAAGVDKILRRVRDTGVPVLNMEFAGETQADPGKQEHWLVNYYPVCLPTGEIVGVGCTVTTITDLKEKEKALRESEARFKRLFDSNIIGIVLSDINNFIEANDVFLEMVGYTREDFVTGKISWREMTPPEYIHLDEQCIEKLLTTGISNTFEKEYICKDGKRIPILIGITLLEREPIRFLCFVIDLSELKKAEQQIRQSEERLRLSLEAGAMGIWDWNVVTGELKWSDNLEEIHKMAPGSFDGTFAGFQKIIYPEDREFVHQAISRAVEKRTEFDIEFRIIASDGSIQWMAGKGQVFCDRTGKAVRTIGVGTNITPRKQVEEALRQNTEELERANRLKDEFLAVLSHELRSPLNAIQGWANLLRTRKLDEVATARALETIERNARLQTQLIEDLLDVSRILRGKVSLNIAPINLASTIEASIDTTRLAAEAKSIEVVSFIDVRVGLVLGDANRLQQIVWNLLTNAIKFTPSGGRVEVWLEQHGTEAQIRVRDTGKGIGGDFLPYVFDRFRQADASTTRKHGGLGLGLAIVRHLVELHGGTVFAESEGEAKGATFTVRLPVMSVDLPPLPQDCQPDACPDLIGVRVLLVDDDGDSRDFLGFALQQYGASVTAVSSAQLALETLSELKPDVLVSDIGMPQMDGYMLLRQVRALPSEQGGSIPAIALTAYAGEANSQQALKAGFQMHLAKPIDPPALAAAVASISNRMRSEL